MVEYSCGQNLARIFLVIFNLLFVIIGLGLIAAGALLKGGAEFLDVLGDFVQHVPEVGNIAIGIIVLGAVIFLIGIFGCCGSCCSVKCMLILYAVFVIIITIAEIVTVALLFSGKLDKSVTDGLSKLTEKYKMPTSLASIDTKDIISRLIDALFILLQCCDYKSIGQVPPSCCHGLDRDILNAGDLSVVQSCFSLPDPTNSYMDKECGPAITDMIKANKSYVIGVTAGIVVIQVLCVVFAIWIILQINKKNKVSTF